MSKRRVFDIDFPGDEPTETSPDSSETRRGPMAAAIVENADALNQRQAAESAIRAENDRLAHEHVRLKKQGLITDLVSISAIQTDKLTRDRQAGRDDELDELIASIREVGLSNPIQVEATEDGYELIQGYRRLSAYRALHQETGDETYANIPAALTARGEALDTLYRRMVDENLVRRDISFGEMAALAIAYAKDDNTDCDTIDAAVAKLYASTNRQKRSYIRHFATVLEGIGTRLKFPEAIPRALGLLLEKRITHEPGAAAKMAAQLTAAMATTPAAEIAVLKELSVAPSKPKAAVAEKSTAKTTFRHAVPAGTVRCAASDGRVEMRLNRDFSNVDRHRLEQAVEAFFNALDD